MPLRTYLRRSRLALLLSAFYPLSAGAQEAPHELDDDARRSPGFEPAPCPVRLPPEVRGVHCGFVTVPESPRSSNTLRLAVLIAPSHQPSGQPPVMFLMGGPGFSALEQAPDYLAREQTFGALRATRDLIFLDHRGTGFSEPSLACPELDHLDSVEEEDQLDAVSRCHARLRDQVDLAAYRTDSLVRDIDRVRRALDLDRLSLFGGSYSAKLVLQRLRGSPAWLESAALISVIDPLTNYFVDGPRAFQRSLERLDAACTEDPSCHAAFGSPRANLDAVVQALEVAPAEVTIEDPLGVGSETITLTPELLTAGLFELLARTDALPVLPRALREAADGRYALLTTLGYQNLDAFPPLSHGMHLSVLCAEEIAYGPPHDLARAAEGADRIVSTYFLRMQRSWFARCEAWPVPAASPWFHLPVLSRTPTLLLTGSFDPKTPPYHGDRIAAFLQRDNLVEVAHASHSSDAACATELLTSFFADPYARLEAPCAARRIDFSQEWPDASRAPSLAP